MSYTLNKPTYDILETYRENTKDTDPLEPRRVRDWINNIREKLLERKFGRLLFEIDNSFVQDLGKISLELKNVSETSSTYSFDNKILLTTIDIPKGIRMGDGLEAILRISNLDRISVKFKFIDKDILPYVGNGKYDKATIYCFRLGNKLGLYSKDDSFRALTSVLIEGVFQDPIAAAKITNPSYTFNDPYPITGNMLDDVKNIIYKEYLRITINPPVDKTADGEHNITKE